MSTQLAQMNYADLPLYADQTSYAVMREENCSHTWFFGQRKRVYHTKISIVQGHTMAGPHKQSNEHMVVKASFRLQSRNG
jgi:hypothetical protein